MYFDLTYYGKEKKIQRVKEKDKQQEQLRKGKERFYLPPTYMEHIFNALFYW